MIDSYLKDITPDSFSGIIFAFEGIKKAIVLLNGPSGCKFYHSALSDSQYHRQLEFDPLNYPELWFFGQPRIPCTYLDKRDYVYGSKDKIIEALEFMKKEIDYDLIAIVNAPGSALIGDDLESIVSELKFDKPVITMETPGYSKKIWEGFSVACFSLIDKFSKKTKKSKKQNKKRVNILGLSIFHKYYKGDLEELKKLLELCDIEVNCALCCESSIEEIINISNADLNIVINEEYGLDSAKLLEKKFDIPYISSSGAIVGFRYTEEFFTNICNKLCCDISKLIIEIEKARAVSYINLSRLNSLTGLPKGAKFAIHGTISECLGYSRFFIQYFGMVANSISIIGIDKIDKNSNKAYLEIYDLLSKLNMQDALNNDIFNTETELVFADGNIIAKLKTKRYSFSGIEIRLPTLGYIDVIEKTHLGVKGSLFLCEQIINGLLF